MESLVRGELQILDAIDYKYLGSGNNKDFFNARETNLFTIIKILKVLNLYSTKSPIIFIGFD